MKENTGANYADLKIEDIENPSTITIEESTAITFTELDYVTMTPMGQITEIILTLTCKAKGQLRKVKMDMAHFLVIYKEAKNRGINIKRGENYTHFEKDETGGQKENKEFDVLTFIEECIARERDEVGDMFL